MFLKVAFYPPPSESSIQSSQLRVKRNEIFSIIPHGRHRNLLVRPKFLLFFIYRQKTKKLCFHSFKHQFNIF